LSKIDKELETGEFFLKESEKKARRNKERQEKQKISAKSQIERRNQAFIAPEEDTTKSKSTKNTSLDVSALKAKIKKATKKKK